MSAPEDLPPVDGPTGFFWTSGADGRLRVLRCDRCGRLLHPAATTCPDCPAGSGLVPFAVSGDATLVSHSVNAHAWPGISREPPYVLGIVALDDDPRVRLTTLLVGVPAEERVAGTALAVAFERREDAWLPVFGPAGPRGEQGAARARSAGDARTSRPHAVAGDAASSRPAAPVGDAGAPSPVVTFPGELPPEVPGCSREDDGAPRGRRRVPLVRADRFEDRVAFTGVGASERGRRLGRDELSLSVDACRAAVNDAGLDLGDVDGLCAYPGSSGMPGVSSGGVRDLEIALGLRPAWHCGAHETPGQTGMLVEAMLAVAGGLCRHVLCVNAVSTAALPSAVHGPGPVRGESQWRVPYGAASPATWIALHATRYMERYGGSRQALGWIAINGRRHAARNPEALFTQELTMDDYLAARPISSPFGLLDCDVPCDGAIAFVVSAVEDAPHLRAPVVAVEAVGTRITEPQSWDQGTLTHQPNVFGPAEHLWTRTGLRPRDVDVALLYDGFTFNALSWIEALGFCGRGEGWAFVEGATRLGLDGELPLNPHGGQLSAGRSNGWGGVREAVHQLRGAAGARQVRGAEVAVTSSGGGIPGGCLLLRTGG